MTLPWISHLFHEKETHFKSGPGGRRKKIEQRGMENSDSDDGTLTAVGKMYKRIFHFSVITRYFLYVAPLAILIAVPLVLGATVTKKATIGGVRLLWFFSWVEILWVSLWVSKLVSQCLPFLFQFLCGVISSGTRKYALVITALEIPLSLVGWSLTTLTTFVPVMTLNPDQRRLGETSLQPWESVVKDLLFAAWVSTLILLAEKLIIQLISISYHRKQFDDRIKQSKRDVYLLSLLYDASRALFPSYCAEFQEEDYLIHDTFDLGSSHGQATKHARSGSATPMRFIQNVGRIGDKVTAAFGHVAQEVTGKQVFNPTSAHSVVVEALERKTSSEALARRIWMSFVMEGKEALYPEDITDVLGLDRKLEAEESFWSLDVDGNGDISLDEMYLRVAEFSRERYSIANSMHDVDQAINVLDNLLLTVVLLAVVFVFVAFVNRSLTTMLATAGTALLSLSFVFATSAQEVLGSIIFIFVKHPFDVGDRVDIGGIQLVVERISLLYTLFRRVQDQKKTQVANIVLNTTWIDNVSRSKAMKERITLDICFDTTFEDVELLKKEMQAFVADKENSRDFLPDTEIEVTDVGNMSKLELTVEIRHKSNWAIESVRAARRSKFMCALVLALRKVPIYGPGGGGPGAGDPANPTYSVAISDEQAASNKKEFSDNQDKKRLAPRNANGDANETVSSPVLGKSLSPADHFKSTEVDAAIINDMNPRKAARARAQSRPKGRNSEDSSRESDIEEVRGLLRRESTRGRRKASQQCVLPPSSSQYQSMPGIPTIIESPPVPIQRRTQYFAPPPPPAQQSTNYDEDTQYAPQAAQPPIQPYATATRPSTGGSGRTMVPGNAFGYQQYPVHMPPPPEADREVSQETNTSNAPARRPVPGMPELKGALIGGPPTQTPK